MIRPGESQREEKSRRVSALAHEEERKHSERVVQAEENTEDAEYQDQTSGELSAVNQKSRPPAKKDRKRREHAARNARS